MDAMTGYISAHPAVLIVGVIVIILFILNFAIKNIMKLILIVLFVMMAAFGYYSLKESGTSMGILNESVEIVKSGIDEFKEKSKSFVKDSKDLYKKSKAAPGEVNKMLDNSKEETKKQ
jgi:multisubunit Na+/H+ antiporter MnhG subunit